MFRPLVADVDLERKRIYVVIVLKHMVEACVRECAIFGPAKNCNASLSISWVYRYYSHLIVLCSLWYKKRFATNLIRDHKSSVGCVEDIRKVFLEQKCN